MLAGAFATGAGFAGAGLAAGFVATGLAGAFAAAGFFAGTGRASPIAGGLLTRGGRLLASPERDDVFLRVVFFFAPSPLGLLPEESPLPREREVIVRLRPEGLIAAARMSWALGLPV